MTELYKVEDYLISSEKIDECPPNWRKMVSIIGSGAGLIISVIGFSLFLMGSPLFRYALLGIIVCLLCTFYPYLKKGCGVRVTLQDATETFGGRTTTTYQLSKNPERDAKKIQKIIDQFTELANKKMSDKKIKEEASYEKRQQCCIQYQEVMDKVEQNDKTKSL